jgi:hypothetical protein
MSSPNANVKVVKVGTKKCKPFIFEVMVYSPGPGIKAEVVVERGCTAANDSVWKFVFDLYKKKATGDGFDQLVHVSYRALTPAENAAIAGMIDGMSDDQADKLPALNDAATTFHDNPTAGNQAAVVEAAKAVVNA